MKALKFFATALLAVMMIACGKSDNGKSDKDGVSETTLQKASELARKGENMNHEELVEAVDVMVELYSQITPVAVNIAKECKDKEEFSQKMRELSEDPRYESLDALYEYVMEAVDSGKLSPKERDRLRDAKHKFLDSVSEAASNN